MKPIKFLVIVSLLIVAFLFIRNIPFVSAQQPKQRYIIVFKDNIPDTRGRNLISAYNASWGKSLNLINAAAFPTDPETAARLSRHPGVFLGGPEVIVSALEKGNETL